MQKEITWDPTAGMASRLLMIDDISLNRRLFLTHDANKNVTGLIEQSGNVAAHYEYHAFGFPTALSPFDSQAPSAQYETSYLNYFLFSSEFYDYELSMSYYNYRHYNPLDGRWLSRDPIEEIGGWNLYGMVNNNISNRFDILGRRIVPIIPTIPDNPYLPRTPFEPPLNPPPVIACKKKECCCVAITIFIETEGFGHTGITIGNNFYDYGPINPEGADKVTGTIGVEGGRFTKDYDFNKAKEHFGEYGGCMMTVMVCKENADKIENSFQKAINNYKTYRFWWNQCTTVAGEALDAGGICVHGFSPMRLKDFLRTQTSFTHECGNSNGLPELIEINTGNPIL